MNEPKTTRIPDPLDLPQPGPDAPMIPCMDCGQPSGIRVSTPGLKDPKKARCASCAFRLFGPKRIDL